MKRNPNSKLNEKFWNMMARCHNPTSDGFRYYGARGITVCPEWFRNFQAFKLWALSSGYQPRLEIDRVDGSKGYSPENCRWVSHKENMQNRTYSAAGRKRISEMKKQCGRPVRCVETGQVFHNVVSACRAINASNGLIGHVLAGRNKTAGGFHWEYAS